MEHHMKEISQKEIPWKEDPMMFPIEKAKNILNSNWTGTYTKPSPYLYPHQWNWDSGFIAIGYSRYHQQRAQAEIRSLFNAQWKNGMVPHIVFNPDVLGSYFPEPDFWQVWKSKAAPKEKLTSGITMPPVHATACRSIFENAKDKKEAERFLKEMFPKLKKSHEYFYRYRDPKSEGLVYIRHPWEWGMDNSPIWNQPLESIPLRKDDLPAFTRKDLKKGIPQGQRPTQEDYDRYVWLVDLFRQNAYEEEEIDGECPFKIQDALVNSILNRSNKDLIFIANVIGEDSTEISRWTQKTDRAIQEKLWHEDHGIFDDFDLYGNRMIEVDTASGFLPLYAQSATATQAKRLYRYLESASFCAMHQGNCFSIPNYNMDREEYNPQNYWRGPIWINMNWMLYHGLKFYHFDRKVRSVMIDLLALVRNYGFHEYFDPHQGIGYGTDCFSWTASLYIDTLYDLIE
jgi:hypothetical protein